MNLPQVVIPVNDKDENERWGMCCSSVYKAEVVFFVQILFLFTILMRIKHAFVTSKTLLRKT